MMLPLLYLFLFGPLLEGATRAGNTGTNAFNWFVPGLLIQIAIFGTAFGGFGLIAELRSGVIERMRVTPMSRVAMLLGRALRENGMEDIHLFWRLSRHRAFKQIIEQLDHRI